MPSTTRDGRAAAEPRLPKRSSISADILGWRLPDLARQDPDYLRWLCRQSAGVRYRGQILQLLPNEPDLDRRARSVA